VCVDVEQSVPQAEAEGGAREGRRVAIVDNLNGLFLSRNLRVADKANDYCHLNEGYKSDGETKIRILFRFLCLKTVVVSLSLSLSLSLFLSVESERRIVSATIFPLSPSQSTLSSPAVFDSTSCCPCLAFDVSSCIFWDELREEDESLHPRLGP
jgi:hypothetical protein